jgi:hypothetical protein
MIGREKSGVLPTIPAFGRRSRDFGRFPEAEPAPGRSRGMLRGRFSAPFHVGLRGGRGAP